MRASYDLKKANHQNFDDEIPYINDWFDKVVAVINDADNIERYLAPNSQVVNSKKYFLSSQQKELYYRDSDRSVGVDLAIDYKKDGSFYMLQISSRAILNHFGFNQDVTKVTIDFDMKQINIKFGDTKGVIMRYSEKSDSYCLYDYNASNNLFAS